MCYFMAATRSLFYFWNLILPRLMSTCIQLNMKCVFAKAELFTIFYFLYYTKHSLLFDQKMAQATVEHRQQDVADKD